MNRANNLLSLGRLLGCYRFRREYVPTMPIRLWVESTNACNLSCVMCPNKSVDASLKGHMSLDLFCRIVNQVRGSVRDIYLHHRGEPLLNPALPEMLAYAHRAGLRTRFHTNGTLLDERMAEALLSDPPDLLSFSVDGFEKDAYERVRVGASFERTLANIFGLLEMRRRRRLVKPYVVIEKIRFRGETPAPEVQLAADALRRRFLDAGADEVIEKLEYVWAEPTGDSPAGRTKAVRNPKAVCTFPWYAMVICWNGAVTACPQDYHAAMIMGQAADESLRDIWNGPAYRNLRRRMASDSSSLPLCSTCDRLCRKTTGGVPVQYLRTFLQDQLLGYGKLRRLLGTGERN
jgi:radical SAM protein with 4Fe4S-binding SPASM domain